VAKKRVPCAGHRYAPPEKGESREEMAGFKEVATKKKNLRPGKELLYCRQRWGGTRDRWFPGRGKKGAVDPSPTRSEEGKERNELGVSRGNVCEEKGGKEKREALGTKKGSKTPVTGMPEEKPALKGGAIKKRTCVSTGQKIVELNEREKGERKGRGRGGPSVRSRDCISKKETLVPRKKSGRSITLASKRRNWKKKKDSFPHT